MRRDEFYFEKTANRKFGVTAQLYCAGEGETLLRCREADFVTLGFLIKKNMS